MAQITLFDLTLRVARQLGGVIENNATGGSTTTIVDGNFLVSEFSSDDYFNEGTAWVTKAGGVAPEGEYSRIGDYTASTGTVTMRTALTAAVAAGDKYAIANRRYPLDILVAQINDALFMDTEQVVTDTTTITTAGAQSEYNLPSGPLTLRQVFIQGQKNDSDDNLWQPLSGWVVQKTASGSADKLVFPYDLPTGYGLKLVYTQPHTANLRLSSDAIDEYVDEALLVQRAIVGCLTWKLSDPTSSDDALPTLLNYHLDRLRKYEARDRFVRPYKQNRLMLPWDRQRISGRYGEYKG